MKSELRTTQNTSLPCAGYLPHWSRNISLTGACVAMSLMLGCASVDKNPQSTVEDNASVVTEKTPEKQVVVSQVQKVKAEEQSVANADAMMASLKAPLEKVADAPVAPVEEKVVEAPVKVVEAPVPEPEPVQATPEVEAVVEKVQVVEAVPEEKKIVVAKPTAIKAPAKPLAISKKDLPANYDIWVLKEGDTPLTQGLVISTPTWEMGKEGYMSQIWLTLKEDEIHINSSSDIATEAKDLGIKIDNGDLIPFTSIAENNIGVVSGEWLDKLANAKSLDIYLGFFPGKKPSSETFKSNTALDNLDRVVATYRQLLK